MKSDTERSQARAVRCQNKDVQGLKGINVMFKTLLMCMFFIPSLCLAGGIYGTIQKSVKIDPEMIEAKNLNDADEKIEVNIKVVCDQHVNKTKAQMPGSYILNVPSKGKCNLHVELEDQSPSIKVQIYDSPVEYNLILEDDESSYTLKRK